MTTAPTIEREMKVATTRDSPTELLLAGLQGIYSRLLYGAAGRLDLDHLRIIWLELLPPSMLALLANITVCKKLVASPQQPFYWYHDTFNNPVDAVWLKPALMEQAAPNHSWVEVTHCARNGHASAMWLYAAPGSGVSINVGRTLVIRSTKHGKWTLLGAGLEGACASYPGPSSQCSTYRTCCASPAGYRENCSRARTVERDLLANYDSLQVSSHASNTRFML